MAVANIDVRVDSTGAVRSLQQVNGASRAAAGGVNALKAAIAPLLTAFTAIQAAKFVFAKTAELETQTRSIQTLTGSVQQAKQIILELQQIGAVTPFTSTELIDTAKRLSAFGVAANDVVDTTKRLGDVAGATGANLGELSLAYGQVMAKGRLQGEELLQFQERGVALQDELRKMYGLTGEEFSKALSKGQISAKAVEVALQRLTDTGGKYANGAIAQSDTLSGRLSTLQDGIDAVAREVGKVLTPSIIGLLQQANTSISAMPGFVNDLALAFQYAAGQIAPFLNGLSQMQWFFTNLTPPGWAMQVIGGAAQRGGNVVRAGANRQRRQQRRSFIEPPAPEMQGPAVPARLKQKPAALPPLLGGGGGGGGAGGGGGGGGGGGAASSKAANDAKRLAEQMQDQLKAADDLNFTLKNRLAIAQTTEPVAKRMLEYDIRQNEIAKEYGELKKLAKGSDELILINANQIIEQRIAQIEYERDINELLAERARLMYEVTRAASMPTVYNPLQEQDAALQSILDKYPAIGASADAAATLATSGMASMIDGTKSAQEVFADFLNTIANALMQTAAKMIAQYIALGIAKMFAFGPGPGNFVPSGMLPAVGDVGTGFNFDVGAMLTPRAKGGSVTAGQPYLVGERGPELFTPGRSGGIAPAGSFGGGMNIVVNVDAKGTKVEGDQQEGAALGRVISAAVQSELIKQQRPGGLLAGAR